MQVVVDGLLTTYERAGEPKRDTVLVLHGWGDGAKGWQALSAELDGEYDVCCVDLPGFGGSQAPPVAWGLSEYASFIAAFLKKTGLKPKTIIAHSNGGAIAVRGLSEGKLKTERLVLIASAGIRSHLKVRRQVLRVFTKAGKALAYPLPSNVKKRLRKHLYTTVGSDLLVAEHMQETFKRIVTDDIQADAAKLKLPTLLIYGEDDAAAPVQYGRILHNLIAGSKLETVAEAGHFVHLDKPEVVHEMIRKFLR